MFLKISEETEENKKKRIGTRVSERQFILIPTRLYNRCTDMNELRWLGFSYVIKEFRQSSLDGQYYWFWVEWDEGCSKTHDGPQFKSLTVPWRNEPWVASDVYYDESIVPVKFIGPWFEDDREKGVVSDTTFTEELIATVEGTNQPLDANAELIRSAPEMYNMLWKTAQMIEKDPHSTDVQGQAIVIKQLLKSILENAKNGHN